MLYLYIKKCWLFSFQGPKGPPGEAGPDGEQGTEVLSIKYSETVNRLAPNRFLIKHCLLLIPIFVGCARCRGGTRCNRRARVKGQYNLTAFVCNNLCYIYPAEMWKSMNLLSQFIFHISVDYTIVKSMTQM